MGVKEMLNEGQKKILKEIEGKSEGYLKEITTEECLRIAYVMLKSGDTRKADEAIRVYKRLKEIK